MEKLSIEQKAKRYDDVIRKAKITLDCCTSDSTITEHVVYDIFPELKESEDERVRELCKVLVRTCFINELCTKEDNDECMAWIEKQVPIHLSHDDENMIRQLTEYFTTGKGLQNTNDTVVEWLEDVKRKFEKQGEQKCVERKDFISIPFGAFDSKLIEESITIPDGCVATIEGNKIHIKKEGKTAVKEEKVDNANKVEPKFKEGDIIKKKSTGDIVTISVVDLKNGEYRLSNAGFIPFKYEHLWELIEQKPSDKVESKFKVGDWITDGHLHCKISEVLDDRYIIDTNFAKRSAIIFEREHNYHLWTIADAKDGDILVSSYNQPFIYNGWFNDGNVGAHCGLNVCGNFVISDKLCGWTDNRNIKPATKEQRQALFNEMNPLGWIWNPENRELNRLDK